MKRKCYVFLALASALWGQPAGIEVVSGSAEWKAEPNGLSIAVSDKAILNYKEFSIKGGEWVRFIQPNGESCVLNRVVGNDPSQIFGSLSGNGRIFLINPNGIYFGPSSQVNANSFLASTLDIQDEDFLAGNFVFEGGSKGSIVNEGLLSAGEGFIAILAPFIENRGSIVARADKIVLASGEKVALDFSGDGLIRFAVDGQLEEALLENYGQIESGSGVHLSMRAASRAIKTVVNTDGIEVATGIEEKDGVIRLVGQVKSPVVTVEGPKVEASGSIEGETVHILGDRVYLKGALVDASGDLGGGTVLIGGDYQGNGKVRNAIWTEIDADTEIRADARVKGDGGKVIVWADDTATFDGLIYARGGKEGGDGGFVETSGKINLNVTTGNVHTISPNGKIGSWLMDPSSITIARNNSNQGAAGLNTAATCSGGGFNLNDTTINNAGSTVILCTAGLIRYNNNAVVNITTAGVGIQHSSTSNPSSITFQTGGVTTWSIVTNNGPLIFGGPVAIPTGNTLSFSTTGGNITFNTTVDGAGPAILNAGSGTITFTGAVGATTALTSLSATGGTVTQSSTAKATGAIAYTGSTAINVGGNITTSGSTITMTGPVTASGAPTIDSTNAGGTAAGATISFSSTLNGATAVTLRAGTAGNVIFTGAVGNSSALTNLSFTSANTIQIGSNITVTGANPLVFPSPVSLTGTSTITSNNANVTFNTTVNGAQSLNVAGGSGTTTFTAAVGGTTPLTALSATAGSIGIGSNITTNGGSIGMTGAATLNGTSIIDTTNSGAAPAGALITFSSNITGGANNLTLNGGTGGTISIGGNLSANAFTLTNSNSTTITGTTTVPTVTLTNTTGNITFNGAATISTTFSVNALGYGVIFNNGGTITPATTFSNTGGVTLKSGSSPSLTFTNGFTSTASATTILGTINATTAAAAVTLNATTFSSGTSVLTTNGGVVNITGATTVNGTATIDSTNGGGTPAGANITLTTIDGTGSLTLTRGSGGAVTFGAVGSGTALASFTASGATIAQNSTVRTTGAITYTGTTSINLGGNLTTSGGIISLTGPIALGTTIVANTTNGAPAGANISFNGTITGAQSLTLTAGTSGAASFGTVSSITSLTASGGAVTQSSTVQTTGAVNYTGTSAINLGGNITTNGATVTATGPATLTAPVVVNTTNGAPAGAAISFSSDVTGGANSLTVNAGTGGTVSIGGNLSASAFTLTNSAGTTITGTTTVPTVTLTNTTGNITFNGAATVSTTFSTAANGYAVVFNNGGTITPATTFNNTGGVTLKSGGSASLNFTNGLTSTVSTTTVLGTVKTTAAAAAISIGTLNFSAGTSSLITNAGTVNVSGTTTLTGNATIDTTNSGGAPTGNNITLSTVNGPGNLTLIAGTSGNILLNGTVGGAPAVGVLTITSANNVTANAITASSIVQSAGSGTTTFNGVVNTSGAAGISLTGTNFAINANMTTQVGSGGPVTINHSGFLTIATGVTISADGGFFDNGSGSATTNLSGNIVTNGQNLTFSKPVLLVGTASLSTGNGTGNILFLSTLDGAQDLTLATGNGNITFTGTVGGTARLGTLTINTTNNVTANALNVTVFNQTAGSGTSAFNGAVNVSGASGFSFVGNNATVNNTFATTAGATSFSVSGTLVLTSSAALTVSGTFSQIGVGSVQSAGSITTSNNNISFAGPVALSGGTTVLNTGGGALLFSSTIDGPGALTMTTGSGNLTITGAAGGSTRIGAITINAVNTISTAAIIANSINQTVAATGTSTYAGDLNTNGASGVALKGGVMSINGNLITTNSGPFAVVNSGTLTLTAGSSTSLSSTFTQSGGGAVSLSGTLVTSAGGISFANAITLVGTTNISTGAGAGNILFSSTIDGASALNLTAGTGTITFTGNVGAGTRLGALTINSSNGVTANNIRAASIAQLSGTGTSAFNGTLDTNGASGIALTGAGFSFSNTVTTTSAGPFSISNSGTATFNSGAICSIAGAFTQSGGGTVAMAGQITAAGISMQSAINLSGTSALTSTGALNDIILNGAIDGAGNTTLTSARNITLSANVGSNTRVGSFTVAGAVNVTTLGIAASSISITSTGLLTVTGDLSTNGASGMTFIVNNFTRTGGLATTNGGPVTETNSGTLTATSTGVRSIDGFFLQNGAGAVIYAGTIQTNNQPITFMTSPITLNGDLTLNAGTTGGNITIGGTVNGAHVLNLAAGTGNISLGGIIGGSTPISALNITSGTTITASAAITAGTITQSAGTTSSFAALTTSLPAGIVLTGGTFTFGGAVATTAAGPFTLSNTGAAAFNANFLIDGPFTQTNSGSVSLGASITTTNQDISFASPVTLTTDSAALNSGTGTGAITLSSTVDGAHTFSVSAGADNANFSGAIGSVTPLTSLTVTGSNINLANIGTSLAAGVSGASSLTAITNLNFNGSIYNLETTTLTAAQINVTATPLTTFTTNGNPITFSATNTLLGTNANLTINSGGGHITLSPLDAGTNSQRTVTLNGGAGTVTVVNIGTVGNGEFASVSLTGGDIEIRGNLFSNAFTFTPSGTIFLGGNITSVNTALSFPTAVVRDTVNSATVSTGSTGANITFSSTIRSDNALTPRDLVLASGAGDISLVGVVGGGALPLNSLTFSTARNVTAAAINAGYIVQSAGTGTTTFGGQITTTNVLGLNLTGSAFSFTNGVNTGSSGIFTVANSGTLSINTGVVWSIGGAFTQTGSGPIQLAAQIDGGDLISFTGPVSLTGTTTLDTSANNKSITFNGTLNGSSALTLIAGTGNIFLNGAAGTSVRLGAFTISSATNISVGAVSANLLDYTWTGTLNLSGALNTNGASGITFSGVNIFSNLATITTSNGGPFSVSTTGTNSGAFGGPITISGSITQSATGSSAIGGTFISLTGNISTNHNITLAAPLILDTTGGNGNIDAFGTIDGGFGLTMRAGTGTIILHQIVGATIPLGALTITSAGNVSTLAISAASIAQTTGTGTTTFGGVLSTTGTTGISITTNSIVRGAAITTTNGGPVTFAIGSGGSLTSTAAGAINIDGAFTQSGTGAVAFGGSILTTNDAISFAGPITLSATSSLSTGTAGAGSITLSNTVQGAQALTLSSGGDDITIGGAVGTMVTPLGAFTITTARNVTAQAITAASIAQSNGSGTTVFQGDLSTTGASGISLAGGGFTFQNNVTTAMGGSLMVTNTGTLTLASSADLSIAGSITQNGSGGVSLGGTSATTGTGTIDFTGAITIPTSASLTTNNQAINLQNTVDGPGSLTMNSGSGDITLEFNAGGSTALNAFTITAAGNVTTQAITASTITQSAGTGTSTFNGDLNASGSGGIQLTGTAFTLLGNATSALSSGGVIAIDNTGTLNAAVGKTISADGGFSQTNTGLVNLGSSVSANNQTISFASAITLTGNVILNSRSAGTGGKDITVTTVNGGFDITFTCGTTGSISAGVIGGITRVGTITATSCLNNNAQSITAGSIVQLAGAGTTTLNGDLNTNTPAGVNLIGTSFFRAGAIVTTNGGSFSVTNSGNITGSGINTTSIDGSYTQNGAGTTFLVGTIAARLGISFSGPIMLAGSDTILDTSGGSGTISLSTVNNYIDGPHMLTLRTASGNIVLSAIGGSTPIGALKFGNTNNITAAAISCASISQEAATSITGTATFNGIISTTGAAGIVLSGSSIAFNNNISTASTGPLNITNTSSLTLANGISVSLGGAFTQTGAGGVSCGASISTANQTISFASPITLIGATTLNSGSTGANITLSSPVEGAFSLSLSAGTGAVSLPQVGQTGALTALTVSSAASLTANSTILVAGPMSFTTTGAQTFSGTLTTIGGSGSIAITNGGALSITSAVTSSGSFIQSQTATPTLTLNGNISTSGTLQIASNTTLTNNIALNSGGGALTLSGTVNSDPTPRNLTLTAGVGAISLASAVGGTNPIAAFRIVSAANATTANISAASILQSAGTGLTRFTGTLSTTNASGVSLTGSRFTFDDKVTTINSGPLTIVHTGTLTLNVPSATHSISGPFSESGGGAVSTAASLTTSAQNISFSDPVTLTDDVTYTSGGGNITFSNTINGAKCLTLSAGTGTIELDGLVGALTSLSCLTASGATIFQNTSVTTTGAVQETATTIRLAGNITTNANNITLTGVVTAAAANITLSTSNGAGTIQVTGTLNGDVSGRNFSLLTGSSGTVTLDSAVGGSVSFNNFTVNSGTININNYGSTSPGATGTTSLTASTDLNFTGTTYVNATQNYTAGSNFNFTNGMLTTITSNGTPVTFFTGDIQLSNDLTINSNGGNVTLTDLFGPGRTLTIDAAAGTATVAHIGTMAQPLFAIDVTASVLVNPFTTFPAITFTPTTVTMIGTDQTGPITFGPVLITADNITFNGAITFSSTLNSNSAGTARNIVFNSTGSNLIFTGAVGNTAALTSITISDAANVTVSNTMNVGAFTQTTGSGTTTFNSGLTTVTNAGPSGSTGNVDITSTNINLEGAYEIAGAMTLTPSTSLTTTNGISCNVTGGFFKQLGTGTVTLSGSIQTADQEILLHGPVTMNGDLSLNSVSASGGPINLDDTVDSDATARNLTFTAGTSGDIQASGAIGNGMRLNSVTAVSAHNITATIIKAGTISQLAGTGTTTLNGSIDTNSPNGITLIGTNFTRSGSITTTNGGSVTVTNSGLITGTMINTTQIDGFYIQNGTGPVNSAGTISARQGISIASPMTLVAADTVLDATFSGGNGDITIGSTINNDLIMAHGITFRTGSGNVVLSGVVGGTQPIGALQFGNVNNVTATTIHADSISQEALTSITGIVTFNGAITTTGASGIVLSGNEFAFRNNITTTGGGPLTLTNTGDLAFSGTTYSLTGAFTQTGGGTVSYAGSMSAPALPISFADPITLTGASAFSTGTGANITFSSAINGGQSLDLTAGTGTIAFGGNLGATTHIGQLTVHTVDGITYPLVNATGIAQLSNTGTTTITGPITSFGNGIQLTGADFVQNGLITTTVLGYTLQHSGSYTMNANISAAGGFTESALSTGTFSLQGSIATGLIPPNAAAIAFSGSGAITLAGAATLNSSVGNGNIQIASTIDGGNNLTFLAGTGSITLNSDVGAIVRLGNFAINSANNVTAQQINAATITQSAGTGLSDFQGAIDSTGAISLSGSAFTIESSAVTGAAAAVTIANSGLFTLTSTGSVSPGSGGNFKQTGTGSSSLSGSITTTGSGSIEFQGAVSMPTLATAILTTANQPITFRSTVNGPGSLNLTAGTQDITFSGNAGLLSSLNALQINTARNVTTQALSATSITQSAGTGTTQFNGDVNAAGAINLTGAAFTFVGNATTTSGGNIAITNSGLLTLSANKTVSSNGSFTQAGAGTVSLAGTVSTNNAALSFASPITLTSPATLSSGAGAGTITISSTIDGLSQPLTLTAGAGDINLNGAVGGALGATRLGPIVVTTVHDLNVFDVYALSITMQSGTGTFSVGTVGTPGALDTTGSAGITSTGVNFFRHGSLTTANGGNVVTTNSGTLTGTAGNTTLIDGSYFAGPGPIQFAGTATTVNGQIAFSGPITLVGAGVLNSGPGGITLSNTVNGGFSLTLNAGTADVTLTQPIGASTALTALNIVASDVFFNNIGTALAVGVSGALSIPSSGNTDSIHFTGTNYNANTQNYTASNSFNMDGGAATTILSNGNPIVFTTGTIQLAASTNLTINTAGGNLTTSPIHAVDGNARALVLNAGAGTLTTSTIGTVGDGEFASASLTGVLVLQGDLVADTISFTPTGTMNIAGNITTTNTTLTFPNAVQLNASRTFSTGSGAGNIVFSSTLNSPMGSPQSLTLLAGTGSITFGAAVGGTNPMNNLSITSANNVTSSTSISAASLSQTAGTGTSTFNDITTTGAAGISLRGNNFIINGTVLNSGAPFIMNQTGTFTLAGTFNTGPFTQNGTGPVAFSGSIVASQPVSFAGVVSLSGTPSIDTSAANQSITFSNFLQGPGAFTLASGAGDILLSKAAGSTTPLGAVTVTTSHNISIQNFTATSLNLVSSTGTATISGALTTSGASGITLVGTNFVRNGAIITTGGGSITVTNSGFVTGSSINTTSISGSYIQNGTGPFNLAGLITVGANISFTSPITLLGPSSFDATAGNGTITFGALSTLNGPQSLTFASGSGAITFNAPIGGINRVGAIAINSAGNVNVGLVNAASFTQAAGTGTTTFGGDLNTNAAGGISLNGTNFVRGANWTTTNSGPISVTISNSGSFTSTAAGTISASGFFKQFGTGAVTISQTVNTSNAAILFSGPVTLGAGGATFNSGSGAGSITFNNTVRAAEPLTLSSGIGDILFLGAVGTGITPLGAVTISSAANATFQSLTAASFTQSSGTGTTTLNGPTTTNTLTGIVFAGSALTLGSTVTTTSNGPISIANNGLFTLSATCSVAGAFTQSGTGSSNLSGSVTSVGGAISFSGPVSITGTSSLITSSQPITISNTLNGPGNFSLNAGAGGNIVLSGTAGSTTRLGALSFNGNNITSSSIRAVSVQQSSGAGTTSLLGDINTSGSLGISLSGTHFTIDGNIITTSGGPLSITHTDTIILKPGSSTLISGPFSETGSGIVSLSGLLHTDSADITFSEPITLIGTAQINSDGTGDILISDTIDGAFDLVFDAGPSALQVSDVIGGTIPLNSLTISAGTVSLQAVHAGSITQLVGTGLSLFNGTLNTTLPAGIVLAGNQFTFQAPVTTTGNGPVQITNSGLLTILSTSPFNLTGAFIQAGSGAVSLSGNITSDNDPISFAGPVTLDSAVALNTSTAAGSITFSNTLNGTNDLSLSAGQGTITFSQAVGGISALGNLSATSKNILGAQNITAASIVASGITGTATFQGTLLTSGAGINLSGLAFVFNGNITTQNGGTFTLANTGAATFSPGLSHSIDGFFLQNGTGLVTLGGTITTTNDAVTFQSPVLLNGNFTINTGSSGPGDITFQSDLDGNFNLTLIAGTGDVFCDKAIGDGGLLKNLTIVSRNINLTGVGSLSSSGSGAMTLTATEAINLTNTFYSAASQVYNAGTTTNFNTGALVTLNSFGGPVLFQSGEVVLSTHNDLVINTNNGAFSYETLVGTTFENLTVNTGTGIATLGAVPGAVTINDYNISAGAMILTDTVFATNVNLVSLHSILNESVPVAINSTNTATFNALGGNVGSFSSPILVNTSNEIFAGAGGPQPSLAIFSGTSADNTVHSIPEDPPCIIVFNGVVIQDCHFLPPNPSPAFAFLTPISISFPIGIEESQFNLASNYYFLPFFIDYRYFIHGLNLYYRIVHNR